MQLHLSTWPDVEDYLKRSTAIILPIGSTEQHGPNGMVGTDAICPEVIAKGVGDETGALVGPTFNVGIAQHHLGFPGSMTLKPSTMIAVMQDWMESLMRHGFDKFYWLNGHGGNIATIGAAFAELRSQYSLQPAGSNAHAPTLMQRNWWQGTRVQKLSKELFAENEGGHATPSEVSLTWAAYPNHARPDVVMTPDRAPYGPIGDAEDYRRRFPDGRIGSNPMLASVEAGEKLLKAAVEDVVEDWAKFDG